MRPIAGEHRLIVLQALLNIISNPVNSTVPIAVETLKKLGVYDSKRVFGVTQLDVVGFQYIMHAFTAIV